MHLKILSEKWRPFCLGLNVLKKYNHPSMISINIGLSEMTCCLMSPGPSFVKLDRLDLWIKYEVKINNLSLPLVKKKIA